jgi:hypothetical protein
MLKKFQRFLWNFLPARILSKKTKTMKKKITLSIPQPCHERWESLTTTTIGAFCSSCNKVVVDFTTMSDAEIVDFIMNNPAHACGRFRSDQLKTYGPESLLKINPDVTLLKAGFLGLLLLLAVKPVAAQSINEKTKTVVVDQKRKPAALSSAIEAEQTIKGVVVSGDDGSAIAGAYVILQGTSVGTITDGEGKFEFPQQLKEGDVLLFSFIGLQTQEYKVPRQIEDLLQIKMKMHYELMGEIVVSEIYKDNSSGMHKWWAKVKSIF